MRKGVAYLRVSSRGQVERDGFRRQLAAIQRAAKRERIEIVDVYQEGISGTAELDHRPALAALLDRIDSNGVRVVMIERADRLARNLLVSEVILDQLRRRGVSVIAADGGDLSGGGDDPSRVLIRQVLASVAEFDRSVTLAKLRAARDRIRRREGRCEGRKPFGHYQGEPEIVGLIHALRRKPRGSAPMAFSRIAYELNSRGIPTRTGKPWVGETVRGIFGRKVILQG